MFKQISIKDIIYILRGDPKDSILPIHKRLIIRSHINFIQDLRHLLELLKVSGSHIRISDKVHILKVIQISQTFGLDQEIDKDLKKRLWLLSQPISHPQRQQLQSQILYLIDILNEFKDIMTKVNYNFKSDLELDLKHQPNRTR